MAYLLLLIAQLIGLLMIPFGLPGIWLQVGALALFGFLTEFATVGVLPIVVVLTLAVLAELAELLLGSRYARRYGGGRKAAWGALIGGIAGAVMGLPLPLIGSIVGAFVGSFIGAAVFELLDRSDARAAVRAGWGALIGRIVATAMKGMTGVVIAVFVVLIALR